MQSQKNFEYELKRSNRSRGIRLSINRVGKLLVTAAAYISLNEIENFIQRQNLWIKKALEKVTSKALLHTQDEISVFGVMYKKELQPLSTTVGVQILNDKLIVTPVSDTAESIKNAVTLFLKNCAHSYIIPRLTALSEQMNISFKSVGFREQSSRWGSCSSSGHLSFNWRLVHFQPQVIDYVLIHELAHRQEMNHSHKFWQIVAKYDPEYLIHRGALKRAGWGEG